MLHRHLLRRLAHAYGGVIPLPDSSVYKSVEWIICVWQRLNEQLAKLGLLDVVFGPCFLLNCPIEVDKPKTILKWLNQQWNSCIATAITDAVIKGPGADTELGGQMKVASTALYVLMQRAVVPGCPLSGQEKERYFASFRGSNELDIKIRGEKQPQHDPRLSPVNVLTTATVDGTATIKLNKSAVLRSEAVTQQHANLAKRYTGQVPGAVEGSPASELLSAFAVAGTPSDGTLPIIVNPSAPSLSMPRMASDGQTMMASTALSSSTSSCSNTSTADQQQSSIGVDATVVRPQSNAVPWLPERDSSSFNVADDSSNQSTHWSPVIVTQPGRTPSPIHHHHIPGVAAAAAAANKPRSATPPTYQTFQQQQQLHGLTIHGGSGTLVTSSTVRSKYGTVLGTDSKDDAAAAMARNIRMSSDRNAAKLIDSYSSPSASLRPASAGVFNASLMTDPSTAGGSRVVRSTKVPPLSSFNTTFGQ
jgi:hypothetical protein